MTATVAFGERLAAAFERHGTLCVGLDPHAYLLREWGLDDSAQGVQEFGLRVVEACHGRVGIIKPQVAFFERHGAAGYASLEVVLAAARAAGLLVIADAKRGDVGSTVEGYAESWLTPGNPLEADAMTMSAFQGVGSLAAPVALSRAAGKGLFILAATSNPESDQTQSAVIAMGPRRGRTVAAGIVDEVRDLNRVDPSALGSFGVVLGATVDFSGLGIGVDSLAEAPATPILAPGFGHQGTQFDEIRARYGAAAPFAIATTSRGVLAAGRDGIAEAINRHAEDLARCLA